MADLQDVTEPLRRDQAHLRAFPFEQSVGGACRAEADQNRADRLVQPQSH